MATTQQTHDSAGFWGGYAGHGPRFVLGETVGEAVCGMTAIVLAIIGLAHADWEILAAITTIVAGAALVFDGASGAARNMPRESRAVISTEFLGGVAGVILGVLAILGIAPSTLVSAAVVVFGASLIVGSIASNRFHSLHTAESSAADEGVQFAPLPELTFAASGAQSLIGLAATVLGIVSLLGQETPKFTLSLVALLIVGAYVVLTSTELARRMMHIKGR